MASDRRRSVSDSAKPPHKTPARAAGVAVAVTRQKSQPPPAPPKAKSKPVPPPKPAVAKPTGVIAKPAGTATAPRPATASPQKAAPRKAAAAPAAKSTPPPPAKTGAATPAKKAPSPPAKPAGAALAQPAPAKQAAAQPAPQAKPMPAKPTAIAPRATLLKPAPEPVRPPRPLPPGSYVLEDQIGFQLRRAHQRATTIFNDVMAKFDVTPTQFAALAKIDDEGPISQNHLGRLTAMDPSTILGVVGRLQRQGLIQLRSTPGDARLTMIELTQDGLRKVVEMKIAAALVSKETLAPLNAADAKTLTDLLNRIG